MKKFSKNTPIIALVLVIVAVVMLFLEPSLVSKIDIFGNIVKTDVKVEGYKVIFGLHDDFDFNMLGFVSLLLIAAGAILPLVKQNQQVSLLSGLVLIAGGVLMVIFPTTIDAVIGKFQAGWPLITAGGLSVLAGLVNLSNLLK